VCVCVCDQVIHDYPSIRQVNLICNTTNVGVVAPLGYNGLLILSCTFYAFKVTRSQRSGSWPRGQRSPERLVMSEHGFDLKGHHDGV